MIRDLYPTPEAASPDERDALERRLLARFDQLHPQKEVPMPEKKRLLFALALIAGVTIALRAPAQYPAEVGRRITIHEAWPEGEGPDVAAIVAELKGSSPSQVDVRRTIENGASDLEITLFAENLPADIEQRLRAKFPELEDARIDVTPVEGRVKTSVAGWIKAKLLQAGNDPAKLEAARREVQAELQKQNPGAHVDVQVGDGKVRVKVIEDEGK
jgi:hypothetical protein